MIRNKFKIWDRAYECYIADGQWFTPKEAEEFFIHDRHECHGVIYCREDGVQVRGESFAGKKMEDTLEKHRDWTAITCQYWTNDIKHNEIL